MSRFHTIVKPVLTLGFLLLALGANAHEFWIQPHNYRLAPGGRLVADLRVGMNFGGNALAFLPNQINAFNIIGPDGTEPVSGRIGDIPAVNTTLEAEGLHILTLFSTASRLTWSDAQKFEDFVKLHGMDWVLERHRARGLPETGFKEAYTRFVKTLVAVGNGAGQDHFTGMFFELVAGKNPYTDDISGGMPITVMFRGAPLADKQVDLFFRAPDGNVRRLSVQSDGQGRALVPSLGPGEYMVNVVHMVEGTAQEQRQGVVWHSLWASVTYRLGD